MSELSFNCDKCGHINVVNSNEAAIDIRDCLNWKVGLTVAQVNALGQKFTQTTGTTVSGVKYRTLFLSAENRRTLLVDLLNQPVPSLEDSARETYTERVLPAMVKVFDNFNVLGALSEPRMIKLAVIDLTTPIAVYCFMTVEDVPDLQNKLENLGLGLLTSEGTVDTLTTTENILGI